MGFLSEFSNWGGGGCLWGFCRWAFVGGGFVMWGFCRYLELNVNDSFCLSLFALSSVQVKFDV